MKKQFTPKEKAAVALEAIREIKTTSQVASEYQVHPIQVGVWKKQLLTNSPNIFSEKSERDDQQKTIDELYKIIGQREAELSWLKKKLSPFNSP
jgi:transposase-like protein